MHKTIIVDRNPLTSLTLKTCLWKIGYNVVESNNELEALNLIITKRPDTVFVSLEFDKQRIVGLVRYIRSLHCCKIIVYSDIVTKNDFVKCYVAPVDDIIVDPCNQVDRLKQHLNPAASEKKLHA